MQLNIIDTILYLSDICYTLNEDSLKDENISRPESFVLMSIKPGELITSNELAERNKLSPSRISRIVDHLIEKNLLLRTEVQDDRRYINLSLTKEGIKKHITIISLKNKCEKKIKSQLKTDELKTVENGFNLLTKVMEK